MRFLWQISGGHDRGRRQRLDVGYTFWEGDAVEHGIRTIAFPSISTGVYVYPVEEASIAAVRIVQKFCGEYMEEKNMKLEQEVVRKTMEMPSALSAKMRGYKYGNVESVAWLPQT